MDESGRNLAGHSLGHYRIQSVIGAGGMGEVYRATDTKLARDVALKVLPREMARDPERLARFQREARAVAALNHPHIVTIFSVEEADGVHFLTMELVEGQALDRMIPEGGFPLDRIIEIAGALADALSAAHEKGIMHRDLKPANVMVTDDGRVKVLDFGLAKETRAEANENTLSLAAHTQAGVVMGTPAYMSPEQVVGRALDHRTDVFSLGVMLHEMATGQRPFGGQSSAELTSAILRDTPPLVTDVRAGLPPDLARIIRRCLEKDPRHRMQTARDVANEFRDLARQPGRKSSPAASAVSRAVPPADSGAARAEEGFWVAVLPFKYTGSSQDLKSLAEGLSEEAITGLSRFSYLRVIARGSTVKYSGESGDVRAIGKELGARYVMEATLRQAGSKLRLAVQLLDTVSGAHLWAENYERTFSAEAAFELQDDLVSRIVSTVADINGVLARSMSESVRKRPPDQLTPYEAVLRSFGYFERVTAEEMSAAMAGLESAVEKSPGYADAWAMLALLLVQSHAQGFAPAADSLATLARGAAAARKAVEAAPANHLAWFSLSQVLFFQKDFQPFRNAAERALALNPMDGNSLAMHGEMLALSGEWERGDVLQARARELNPHHPSWYWHGSFNHAYWKRDYRAALEIGNKMNQTNNWGAHALTAAACGQLGDHEGAARAVRELLKIRPDAAVRLSENAHKWFDPEHAAHVMEGMRKAGLEIPLAEGAAAAERPPAVPKPSAGARTKTDSGGSRTPAQAFWIAVLPFTHTGADTELEPFAAGLADDIAAGLAKFPYLSVLSRGSAGESAGQASSARYRLEGRIRKSATAMRINAQLIDTLSGAHLWAETYDRDVAQNDIFVVQDDITDRVVATIADSHGVLVRSMEAGIEEKPEAEMTALDWTLRGVTYRRNVTPEAHASLREGLERFVEREPRHADLWGFLALVYLDEFSFGFNARPGSLDRALAAARRSVNIDRTSQNGNQMLAQVHFFRRDVPGFRAAAEQAIGLNPRNTSVLAGMAMFFVFIREFERGTSLARRAMDLNPHHPGWYHVPLVWDYFQKGEYEQALDQETRINIPGLFWQPLTVAACCGILGRHAEAAEAVEEMRRLDKNIELHLRRRVETYNYASGFGERILEGLAKAGLRIAAPDESLLAPGASSGIAAAPARHPSGAVRAADGFWVAVLPFKYSGTSQELKSLAEGLSDEVITGLSRFSYLRVIARGSTVKYSGESGDVRAIGNQLGARYVMEGSLRQSGSKLRLAVRLVDTVSGTHLWAETYERTFNPDTIFELQDDLVPRIVSTAADQYGVLPRSISDVLRGKSEEGLTPNECLLRAFSYFGRITPEEHAVVRRILERAVREAPDQADCWAMLAQMYNVEFADDFNLLPDPLDRALAAAQRAVDLAPAHSLGYYALAYNYFFRKEMVPFRAAVERAVALNPMDGAVVGQLGLLMDHAGYREQGSGMVERAMRLNPNYPPVLRFNQFTHAYHEGRYEDALEVMAHVNMPGFFHLPAARAAALGQLGQREAAQKALGELLALRPDIAKTVRRDYLKWWDTKMVERLVDGLQKAGLVVEDEIESQQ